MAQFYNDEKPIPLKNSSCSVPIENAHILFASRFHHDVYVVYSIMFQDTYIALE